jgi:hypothetical protein
MLIDKETPDAIYVYNISQEQLPLIVQKYYPGETRPVIAVNHTNPAENRWVSQYDQILHETYEQSRGSFDRLVPLFNLAAYDFD